MKRVTRRIGETVEFVDGKGYSKLSQQEVNKLLLNTLADYEDKENNTMSSVLNLETWLYKQSDKSLEIKASMFWGALIIAKESGQIDWDDTRLLFGEFMSKELKLR